MARSTKILQSFILRNLKLPYTCRENLTQSQISDFFSLNLTIFDQFWPKSQIRRKIAVLPPFWMIRHFFSRQNFSFFSSGIERPFYRFSTNVWFSRVISNGFGSNLLRNLGKTTESALFRRFSWYVEVIYSQTAQKWSSKLYTGRKLKERPLYSIGKKSIILPWEKWRIIQNGGKTAIFRLIWLLYELGGSNLDKLYHFSQLQNRAQYNEQTHFEIWKH